MTLWLSGTIADGLKQWIWKPLTQSCYKKKKKSISVGGEVKWVWYGLCFPIAEGDIPCHQYSNTGDFISLAGVLGHKWPRAHHMAIFCYVCLIWFSLVLHSGEVAVLCSGLAWAWHYEGDSPRSALDTHQGDSFLLMTPAVSGKWWVLWAWTSPDLLTYWPTCSLCPKSPSLSPLTTVRPQLISLYSMKNHTLLS